MIKSCIGKASLIATVAVLSLVFSPVSAGQVQAQSSRTEVTQVQSTARTPARAPKEQMKIAAPPGTVKSLCCGSVNTQQNTGENCAFLAHGANCGGDILSCAPGQTEWIDPNDGDGGCD